MRSQIFHRLTSIDDSATPSAACAGDRDAVGGRGTRPRDERRKSQWAAGTSQARGGGPGRWEIWSLCADGPGDEAACNSPKRIRSSYFKLIIIPAKLSGDSSGDGYSYNPVLVKTLQSSSDD